MAKTIAVDIGHGTNTSGKGVTVGGRLYKEHTFNSAVGGELDKLLKHNGFNTIMYQKPNAPEVNLNTRIKYYNSKNVDLVWSIHADANSNKSAKGRYGFYWYQSSASKKLATLYAEEVKKAGYTTRGDGTQASQPNSWTNLAICRDTNADAVLTENGFMTNDQDFQLIFKSEKYAKDIARIHARAICRFFGVAFKDLGTTTAPAGKPTVTTPPSVTGNTYTIKKGDTLWDISQALGMTVAELQKLNPGVDAKSLQVGGKLIVKGTAPAATYTIKKGDTLWDIAQAYNTTVAALEKLNPGVKAKALQVGDVLKVTGAATPPAAKPPAAKPPLAQSSAVRPYPGKPLVLGSKGRDVEALQRALGFKGNAIDGSFGLNTLNAVKNYQSRHNLAVDGSVGPATWNTIF